jgi:hypothetical protein
MTFHTCVDAHPTATAAQPIPLLQAATINAPFSQLSGRAFQLFLGHI